jgi:ABC-type sugar transport system permease subunit
MEVYEQPISFFVADFIGQSQFVKVVLRSAKEACVGDAMFRLAQPAGRESGSALMLLRPDKVELLAEGDDREDLNVVSGWVTDVVYQGEQVLVSVGLVTGENILVTTLRVSAVVTVVCVLLGYPVAYLIAQLPRRWAMMCLSLVLIPFWTSVLVRSYAWLILLNAQGPITTCARRWWPAAWGPPGSTPSRV